MNEVHDAIVIGGGHNGLTASCYLARAGLDTVVVEAQATLGGMAHTAAVIPGAPDHRINTCALDTVFLRASDVVRDLGLAAYGFREIECDPANVYLRADGSSIAVWKDARKTAEEIGRFSRDDARAYLELVRVIDAVIDVGLPFLMTNPQRPEPAALGRMAWAGARQPRSIAKAVAAMSVPVAQTIDERFQHPVTRDFLAGLCSAIGPITEDGSGLLLLLFAFQHRFGAWRIAGGTQALPDALESALRGFGGSVLTSSPVEEVLVSGGRTTGVRLADGREIHARRGVIATCDPKTALLGLVPADALTDRVKAKAAHIPSFAGGYADFKVDVALSGRLRLDRYEKIRGDGLDLRGPGHFMGSYEAALTTYQECRAGQIPRAISMYTAVPTGLDPSQAPKGQDTLYLWVNPMPLAPAEDWEKVADAVVNRAAEYYEGIEELEIDRAWETPDQRAARLRVSGGCVYHVDMTMFRMGPLRPALGLAGFKTPLPGFYLGGAGCHPSGAVTGIPGRLAARELLRSKR
jgi:phytoene dehydrogenase-like protein